MLRVSKRSLGQCARVAVLLAAVGGTAQAQITVQAFNTYSTTAPGVAGPVLPGSTPVCTTTLASINFTSAAQLATICPTGLDGFGEQYRFTGSFVPTGAPGTFTLGFTGDDGYQVFVNGSQVISAFFDQGPTRRTFNVTLGGAPVPFVIDYYANNAGGSYAALDFPGGVGLAATTAPEPATVALMATGLLAVGAAARRRRQG